MRHLIRRVSDTKRAVTIRRRARRPHRCLRVFFAMIAAGVAGCAFGIALTAILRAGRKASKASALPYQETLIERAVNDAAQFAERVILGNPSLDTSTERIEENQSLSAKKGNCSAAQELWEEVKVLCWVMTRPENHATKAVAVKETWGRRCNALLFMSSKAGEMGRRGCGGHDVISKRHEAYFVRCSEKEYNPSNVTYSSIMCDRSLNRPEDKRLPAVALNVPEGRDNLWSKTRQAFSYLHAKGYLEDKVDWVLKADDDTFVVMENLRYFLSQYDPKETVYVGLHFKKHIKEGFMSGGTGYVLSRTAAKRFVTEALPGKNSCRNTTQRYEDVEMGRCMAALKAKFISTMGSDGKHRSFPYQPEKHLMQKQEKRLDWLVEYLQEPMKTGEDCCSRTSISFHYITPERMREMYYLIYSLTPYGIRNLDDTRDHVTHDYNTSNDILDTKAC